METNLLLFLQIFFWQAQSHSPAYILNQHLQLVTSSSLQWVQSLDGNRPLHSVEGGRNGSQTLYVCRSYELVGQLNNKGCGVVTGQTIQIQQSHYEVLSNVDGSARLEWVDWKQFSKLPPGAVSVKQDHFVARDTLKTDYLGNLIKSKRIFIGGLNLQDEYGLISLPPDGHKVASGQLLVEHEPIRYELKSFRYGKVRHVTSNDVTLNHTIELASDWPNSHHTNTEGRIINYNYNETIYFGKGHNLQTGSDVTLCFENGSQVSMKWGLPQEISVGLKLRMNYEIPPDSSVLVHIMATRIDRKLEYTATLVSHYQDGQTRERPIEGVYRQVIMEHLRPVYGFPRLRHHHKSNLNAEIENEHYRNEEPLTNDKYLQLLDNRKDEKRVNDVTNSTTKGYRYEDSEERVQDVNDEWRLPRDNWKKVAWLKPLTSSSCNHLATLHFISIFLSAQML